MQTLGHCVWLGIVNTGEIQRVRRVRKLWILVKAQHRQLRVSGLKKKKTQTKIKLKRIGRN